jgi:hypothetical protein
MNAERAIAQEPTDEGTNRDGNRNGNRTADTTPGDVTGPHFGRDEQGRFDHRYWRCEDCGFESIDPRLRRGCFRCAGGDGVDGGGREGGIEIEPRERGCADAE